MAYIKNTLLTAFALATLAGCAADVSDDMMDEAPALGEVSLPLSATVNGTVYRFRGQLEFRTYPASSFVRIIQNPPEGDVWTFPFAPGSFYVYASGPLVRVDGATETPVTARIVQPEAPVKVTTNETTAFTLRFLVDGVEVPLARGNVKVDIQVQETAQAGQSCNAMTTCRTGLDCAWAGRFYACLQPCTTDADCTAGLCQDGHCY